MSVLVQIMAWYSNSNFYGFFPAGSIENKLVLVQVIVWRQAGDKPLSEPMVMYLWPSNTIEQFEGILPKGPYLPCVSMAGRALLAGYPRIVPNCKLVNKIKYATTHTASIGVSNENII